MKLLGLSVIGILSGMNRQTYVHLPGKSHTTDDNGQRSRITGGRTSSVDGGESTVCGSCRAEFLWREDGDRGRWGRMKAAATHPGGGDAWAEAHVQVWCI